MPVFEMCKLCLCSSTCKHTRTKNNEGLYGLSLRLKKHMRVVETYVILGHYLHSSYLLQSLTVIIWFKKNKYNNRVNELILIFKSKSQITVWKMNLLTEHYPVYGNNTYLNAEKNEECTKFTSRNVCMFTELNQLIFR